MILDIVLNFSIVATEFVIFYLICDGLFKKKRNNTQQFWGLLGLTVACYGIILVDVFYQVEIIMRTAILLFCVVWCINFFHTTWLKALFSALFFQGFMFVCDLVVLLGSSALLFEQEVPSNQIQMYLGIFAKLFELFLTVFLWRWLKKRFHRAEDSWLDWARTGVIPASCLFIGFVIFRMFLFAPNLSQDLLICTLIILIVDVSSIFLLDKLEAQHLLARDHAILQQSLKREQESLASWENAYKIQRKQTHDMKNHLLVLQGMAEEQAPHAALSDYLSKLLAQWSQTEARVSTRRNVVDILLNQKYAIAKAKGIHLEMQLADLSAFPLPDDELIVVLSNVIDNAIAACCDIQDQSQRHIRLRMDVSQGAGHLHIENTTATPVHVVDNQVIKIVDDAGQHGYGLQNVRHVFDKHDAIYVIDYLKDSGLFVVSAQIIDERTA